MVVGRSGVFAKCRRQSMAPGALLQLQQSHRSISKGQSGRSGSLSQKKARGTRSNVIVHEDDSEEPTDSAVVLPSHFHKDGATQRRDDEEAEPSRQRAKKKRLQASLDFPSAVIEMARRASSTKRSSTAVQRSTDSMEITSTEQSSTVGTDDADGRQLGSPHRRRVVDVSDHKTCALLMTKIKEANRNQSPHVAHPHYLSAPAVKRKARRCLRWSILSLFIAIYVSLALIWHIQCHLLYAVWLFLYALAILRLLRALR